MEDTIRQIQIYINDIYHSLAPLTNSGLNEEEMERLEHSISLLQVVADKTKEMKKLIKTEPTKEQF